MIRVFNSEPEVVAAGIPALRIYFCLFIPMSLQMAGGGGGWGGGGRAGLFSSLRRGNGHNNAAPRAVVPMWRGAPGVFTPEAISQLVGGLACSLTHVFHRVPSLGRLPDRPPENI